MIRARAGGASTNGTVRIFEEIIPRVRLYVIKTRMRSYIAESAADDGSGRQLEREGGMYSINRFKLLR